MLINECAEKITGYSYWTVEGIMPRISDAILGCSIYLYPSVYDARNGEKSGGSGFLVGVPSTVKGCGSYIYAVTNYHVVCKEIGNSPVIRINTVSGQTETIEYDYTNWYRHPDGDDIAIAPINKELSRYKLNLVSYDLLITPEIISNKDIGAGDDVFMVGRFIGYDGKQKNEPTIRFGNLSLTSTVKMRNDDLGIEQESFLIEVRSLSGYSGSPVFVKIQPLAERPGVYDLSLDSHKWLLGVDWGHQPLIVDVLDKYGKNRIEEKWKVKINSGVACIVPAWKLAELLNIDELAKRRKENDGELEKRIVEQAETKVIPQVTLDSKEDNLTT